MFTVFNWKVWVAIGIWPALVVAFGASLLFPVPGLDKLPFASRAVALVVEVALSALLWNPVWRWLWRVAPQLGEWIYPDLNGDWTAEVESNWPRIESLVNAARGEGTPFNVFATDAPLPDLDNGKFSATIFQSWASMSMDVKVAEGLSTEIVVVPRRIASGRHELALLFKQSNPKPRMTDEREFEGAAILTIKRGGALMSGRYWTNRNWMRGLNTAGLITFQKRNARLSAKHHS